MIEDAAPVPMVRWFPCLKNPDAAPVRVRAATLTPRHQLCLMRIGEWNDMT